jgi:hypothetical protein
MIKRIVIFALVAFAGWYGWHHWTDIAHRAPSHEAVVENDTGVTMEKVRLTVDGQTFVKEILPNGQRASFPFRVANDASFALDWEYKERLGERHWRGGMVPRGPMVQRHMMQVDGDGGVVYTAGLN